MGANTIAYTLMPEPNQTYLVQTKNLMVPADPLSGSTVGLMMILSTFQYQPSLMGSNYVEALSQASQAAFVASGGQQFENKTVSVVGKDGIDFAHSIGIDDTEMGVVGFSLRTVQRKQFHVNGPRFYGIKSNLTLSPGNGDLGLSYEW